MIGRAGFDPHADGKTTEELRAEIDTLRDQLFRIEKYAVPTKVGLRYANERLANIALICREGPFTGPTSESAPRCGCPPETVRRVIEEHGTCSYGGVSVWRRLLRISRYAASRRANIWWSIGSTAAPLEARSRRAPKMPRPKAKNGKWGHISRPRSCRQSTRLAEIAHLSYKLGRHRTASARRVNSLLGLAIFLPTSSSC